MISRGSSQPQAFCDSVNHWPWCSSPLCGVSSTGRPFVRRGYPSSLSLQNLAISTLCNYKNNLVCAKQFSVHRTLLYEVYYHSVSGLVEICGAPSWVNWVEIENWMYSQLKPQASFNAFDAKICLLKVALTVLKGFVENCPLNKRLVCIPVFWMASKLYLCWTPITTNVAHQRRAQREAEFVLYIWWSRVQTQGSV